MVAVLAVAIGLALAMLVANRAVAGKVAELNASVGTVLTVTPAGGQGFEGGGEPPGPQTPRTPVAPPQPQLPRPPPPGRAYRRAGPVPPSPG